MNEYYSIINKSLFERYQSVAATLVVARESGSFSGRDKPCSYNYSRLFKQALRGKRGLEK